MSDDCSRHFGDGRNRPPAESVVQSSFLTAARGRLKDENSSTFKILMKLIIYKVKLLILPTKPIKLSRLEELKLNCT